ncbi:MAG TPA: hypothetical protein VLA01_02895 [Nitrosopumilaceae archaeon]|nr:hypothetical protein [Nitrosopumilaceae archaeon]
MIDEKSTEIRFLAYKVHIHHWPPETPKWSNSRKKQVDQEINHNKEEKQIEIKNKIVQIKNYEFSSIKKVGITIPLFKKQCTMIFEGHCQEFDAHVHITTKEKNYLETFNKLMSWRTKFFPET